MTKDERFNALVAKRAKERNCIFFVNNGEGREFETDLMSGEDLFGWLIPMSSCDEFRKEFITGSVSGKWEDFQCFAIWNENNGNIFIDFKNF
ncbi:MAG: hypothetical protein E7500_05380 [Ruminococcus sp.]|nr:hypothetical protein [Ruminococcus sp.]